MEEASRQTDDPGVSPHGCQLASRRRPKIRQALFKQDPPCSAPCLSPKCGHDVLWIWRVCRCLSGLLMRAATRATCPTTRRSLRSALLWTMGPEEKLSSWEGLGSNLSLGFSSSGTLPAKDGQV
ncbi:hypothetical protein DPEC_G00193820 [Dallia pectoralis]|uniref:Uncharacterized protein n=1 Tax=Dallia pectoralis TaxID=75939 RepID=A0ACC2G729_DALPE|nr:hypothetical protein DPEC_G00193820 [Dallia pectoralis]